VTDIGVGLRWVESWSEGKDICVEDFRIFESSGSLVLVVSRFSSLSTSPTPPPLSNTQLRFSVLDKGSFNLVPVPHTVTFSSTTSGERAILQPHITLPPRKEIYLFDFSFSSLRSHQGSHRHPPAATVTLLQLLSLSSEVHNVSCATRASATKPSTQISIAINFWHSEMMSSPLRTRLSNELDPYSAAHVYYDQNSHKPNHFRTRTFSTVSSTACNPFSFTDRSLLQNQAPTFDRTGLKAPIRRSSHGKLVIPPPACEAEC
jgi:hypothetical protein